MPLLRADERTGLEKLRTPRRRAQFTLGRVLLRTALCRLHGVGAEAWRLRAGPGAPRLEGDGAPCFSLAHARHLVACAICSRPVGLDVEFRRERDFAALAEFICTPEEWQEYVRLSGLERGEAFYRLWTLKEAIFKLKGGAPFPSVADASLQSYPLALGEDYVGFVVTGGGEPVSLHVHPPLRLDAASIAADGGA